MLRATVLGAALVLASGLAPASQATWIKPPAVGCVGDFDILQHGLVVGHLTVNLHSIADAGASPGELRLDDGDGPSQLTVGRTWFLLSRDGREAWFEGLEVEFPGPRYEAVVGRIVAVDSGPGRGFVELRNQILNHEGSTSGALAIAEPQVERFEIGDGLFDVWAYPGWPMIAAEPSRRATTG